MATIEEDAAPAAAAAADSDPTAVQLCKLKMAMVLPQPEAPEVRGCSRSSPLINLTICIPVILDPRFKFGFIEFRLKKTFHDSACENIVTVDQTFRGLFSGYSSQMGATSNNGSHMAQGNDTTSAVKGRSWSDWSDHVNSQRHQVNNELERYLRDELHPCDDDNFDILDWWKMHGLKYPILSCMARDVLAVPASTVPSESAFSTGGRVINDYRTRLSINTVEALICFEDWLRTAGSSYLDIISIATLDTNSEDS